MPEPIEPGDPKRRKTQAGDFPPNSGAPRPADSPNISDADPLPSGTGLGKYRILERIASSQSAILYKARDHLLDRPVVIKQLAPQLADDPGACGRFRKEAYTLAQIGQDARYVVAIHELIEHQRGLFLVTEYVAGWSLETLIAKRQLSLQAVLELIARICLGLRAVHASGFIHRDLAPRHIITDSRCRPKITDFGLATTVGADPDFTIASPPYTAPEVFLNDPYDDRCDIYSAGAIAYEMLVGRKAFRALIEERIGKADDPMRWLAWHASDNPIWPDAHEVNPLVPPVLSAIIARMMEHNPDDRFNSVDDVLTLLVRHFSRAPRSALPPPANAAAQPWAATVMPPAALPEPEPEPIPAAAPWAGPTAPIFQPFAYQQPQYQPPPYQTPAYQTPHHQPQPWNPYAAPPIAHTAQPPAAGRAQTQTVSVPVGNVEITMPSASAAPPWSVAAHVAEPRKPIIPPTWVLKNESAGSESPRPRRNRFRRRALTSLTVLTILCGAGYATYRCLPLLFVSEADSVATIVANAKSAYAASDFVRAAALLRDATAAQLKGVRGLEVRDEAVRWQALAEARLAMQNGDLDRAEEQLRSAVANGIKESLIADFRRDLIKAQSATRLKKQFGDQSDVDAPSIPIPGDVARPTSQSEVPSADEPATPASRQPELDPARKSRFDKLMRDAREALEREDYDDAVESIRAARIIRITPENDELNNTILLRKDRAVAIKLGDSAMKKSEFEDAVKQYRAAMAIEADPALDKKLRRAVSMQLIDEGQDELEQGNVDAAATKFRAAKWRDPSCDAEKLLKALEPAQKAVKLVRRADQDVADGKPQDAIHRYQAALPTLPKALRPEVERKIANLKNPGG